MDFGNHEYAKVDINKLVVLPQVRKSKNSRIDELTNDIEQTGLINAIDICILTREELKKHISFLNQLWKTKVDINNFVTIDNNYYVVIAGHSRLISIERIIKRNKLEELNRVKIKIHEVKTSEEILAIQLGENIHKEIKAEERAIAIIGTYRLGLMNGKWNDKTEFIKKNKHKFSRDILNDAVVFAELPLKIQEYVFSNNIPFTVGVELGRILPLVKRFEAHCNLNGPIELTEEVIKLHYGTLLMKLQKTKSIKRGLSMIIGHIDYLTAPFREQEEVQQQMMDLWNTGAERQGEMHFKQRKDEHKKAKRALTSMPYEYFQNLLSLDENLTGENNADDLKGIKNLYREYTKRHLDKK